MKKISLLFIGRQVKYDRSIQMHYTYHSHGSNNIPIIASAEELNTVIDSNEPFIVKYVYENVYGFNAVLHIGTSSGEQVQVQAYGDLKQNEIEILIKAATELKENDQDIEINVTNFWTEEMKGRLIINFNSSNMPHATNFQIKAFPDKYETFKFMFNLDDSNNIHSIDREEYWELTKHSDPIIGIMECSENQPHDHELFFRTRFGEDAHIYDQEKIELRVFERFAEVVAQSRQDIYYTITI